MAGEPVPERVDRFRVHFGLGEEAPVPDIMGIDPLLRSALENLYPELAAGDPVRVEALGASRMAGPGWMMIGDAYAFIDPIFSSGVFLAMDAGERGAEVVDGALREPTREAALQKAMARRTDRGLRHFSWFIHRFTTPVMQRLFATPRNDFQIEQAVISMLAGDVFDNRPVRLRLYLFRLLYLANALAIAPQALRGWRQRRRRGEVFTGDTLQEGNP